VRLLVEAANMAVGVEHGMIIPPTGRFDIVVRVKDGELRPGLINAHDHLHRNHYGRLGLPPYRNAYEWGADIHARYPEAIAFGRTQSRESMLRHGAEKNLRAGVTTVVHHDPWEQQFDEGFPLRVLRVAHAHALKSHPPLDPLSFAPDEPFMIHLAEGTDESSAQEIRDLDRLGFLTGRLLAVHVVGADACGIDALRSVGACVVWCPTSNIFLFESTAPAELLAPGMDVLLGSDSMLTGAGTLLDEIQAARERGLLSDDRLHDAVGMLAARRLGVEQPSLEHGSRADFAVFRKPVLDALPVDVALVVANGRLRVLEPDLVPALGKWQSAGASSEMNGVVRWLDLQS
jgi:cytosine/adenosine deaminase-related metal-dependent hydrolase